MNDAMMEARAEADVLNALWDDWQDWENLADYRYDLRGWVRAYGSKP